MEEKTDDIKRVRRTERKHRGNKFPQTLLTICIAAVIIVSTYGWLKA
ncbi:hypothetical protein [Clostridium sp.]